jgi:ABC-2 type transport system ATP-binding protein
MIEMEHLRKDFGSVVAVEDLTLQVPRGEVFCFLGPNGAGKTTTLKMLTGLLRPTSGTARICGLDIQENPVEAKKRIGYIPDMPFLYGRLTASEFYEFVGELYAVPADRIAEEREQAFALFGIVEHRDVLVKDLSHGLKQRLIYVSSFLHKPDVLFIDEPLIGLDPHSIRLIKDLLKAKARAGMTIFLTTHILALAEDVADRIGIFMEGRLVALGTLQELRAQAGRLNLEDIFLKVTASGLRDRPGVLAEDGSTGGR